MFRNCNQAFRCLVELISSKDPSLTYSAPSRVGDVIRFRHPVLITYDKPRERVLFNEARDCNPFFHLMESLWMLAGRNDVQTMAFYNSQIAGIASDDGKTFNGAYGYRWRRALGAMEHRQYDGNGYLSPHDIRPNVDQLPIIIDQLKRKPESRRVVLQMWNVEDDLLKIDETKDVCCNTNCYFEIEAGKLNMTVCNRSNDLVWGMLGANVVHFSFLQEYLAAQIGVSVGVYHQFTNNLHVYTERFKPEEWLGDMTPDHYEDWPVAPTELVTNPERFDSELPDFVNLGMANLEIPVGGYRRWKEPFFREVAFPAALAYVYYKKKDFKSALAAGSEIMSDDWRNACTSWMMKRKAAHENKNAEAIGVEKNPYAVNELKRQETGSDMA